jgi:hypothetical protein
MNRSNPSTVDGGGEMKRVTSSVVSIAKSDGASEVRSSRSRTWLLASTGRLVRQLLLTTSSRVTKLTSVNGAGRMSGSWRSVPWFVASQ